MQQNGQPVTPATPGNETLMKIAHANGQLVVELQKQVAELTGDLRKLAEGAEEVLKDNAELKADNETLAEAVSDKIEGLVETATNPATTDAISDSAKDAIVEAVAKVDGDVADDLNTAIEDAADKGELTGEKMASLVAGAVNALVSKVAPQTLGREIRTQTPNGFGKQAGSRGTMPNTQESWTTRGQKLLQDLSKINGKR